MEKDWAKEHLGKRGKRDCHSGKKKNGFLGERSQTREGSGRCSKLERTGKRWVQIRERGGHWGGRKQNHGHIHRVQGPGATNDAIQRVKELPGEKYKQCY